VFASAVSHTSLPSSLEPYDCATTEWFRDDDLYFSVLNTGSQLTERVFLVQGDSCELIVTTGKILG
jgi:hypothetical protein